MASESTASEADVFLAPEKLIQLGEQLWTAGEGAALRELKSQLPKLKLQFAEPCTNDALSQLLACKPSPDATAESFRVLAAVVPAFWMVGMAKAGHELIQQVFGALEITVDLKAFLEDSRVSEAKLKAVISDIEPSSEVAVRWSSLPSNLLIAACLDAGGMNAYACTAYANAAELHSKAYKICEDHVASGGAHKVEALILQSRALDGLGRVSRESGQYNESLRLHALASEIAFQTLEGGEKELQAVPRGEVCLANAVSNAGVAAYRSKDFELAKTCHEQALSLRRKLGELRGISSSLGNLALLVAPGENEKSEALYAESLEIRIRIGDTWGVAGSHRALAQLYIKSGQGVKASKHLKEGVKIFAEVSDMLGIAESLESLGLLSVADCPAKAARLLGAAVAVRQATGSATDVVLNHHEAVELQKSNLSEWQQGEKMGITEALELAEGD